MSDLQTIRSELELYKYQHADHYPSIVALQNWQGLMVATNDSGQTVPEPEGHGPYFQTAPVNPHTGKSRVALAGHATFYDGWSFDPISGSFKAVLHDEQAESLPNDDCEIIP